MDGLAEAIDQETALVSLSHTVFKSGYTYPLAAVTEMAHKSGALILWDTSHSVGTRPIDLNAAGVDLAVGCTYKYLNGGPGSPAFQFVSRSLQGKLGNPISGWMGQRDLFKFDLEFQPVQGMRRFLSGTPAVISLAAVEIGVDLILEAGLTKIRNKSIQQTGYLIDLWAELLQQLGYRLNSPGEVELQGSHVSLGHDEGNSINRALIEEMKIMPDFREPDNLRFGIAPLYNSFEDIYVVAAGLKTIVEERRYEKYGNW
jgi:kynureninase